MQIFAASDPLGFAYFMLAMMFFAAIPVFKQKTQGTKLEGAFKDTTGLAVGAGRSWLMHLIKRMFRGK